MLKFLKREIVTLKISDNKIEIISNFWNGRDKIFF